MSDLDFPDSSSDDNGSAVLVQPTTNEGLTLGMVFPFPNRDNDFEDILNGLPNFPRPPDSPQSSDSYLDSNSGDWLKKKIQENSKFQNIYV